MVEGTGLSREVFETARKKMARGKVWDLAGGHVAYSRAGAEMVLSLVGVPAEAAPSLLKKMGGAAAPPPAPIQAKVFRLCQNRRALKARLVDGNELVHVVMDRPKAREKLRRGEVIDVWPVAGRDHFECRLR